MKSRNLFSDFLSSLSDQGEPEDLERFGEAWQALRGALQRELRKRGLWHRPPSWLGILGWSSWNSSSQSRDALDELTVDCYVYIFVHRRASLRAQLDRKPNIEGLVYLNVSHFIHELQGRHDPLGTRIYSILHAAASKLVDEGRLTQLTDGKAISGESILAVGGDATTGEPRADLSHIVETWCDQLLPDLIITRGRGQDKLLAKLRRLILELPVHAVKAFRFRDLAQSLREATRRRWAGILAEAGEPGLTLEAAEQAPALRSSAGSSWEDREAFRTLIECVSDRIARLEDPERRDAVLAIWELLAAWAAEQSDLVFEGALAALAERASPSLGERPSQRQIARLLGLPRDRVGKDLLILREFAAACVESLAGSARSLPTMQENRTGTEMPEHDLEARFREVARIAGKLSAEKSRAKADSSLLPHPLGRLFVLPVPEPLGLEWLAVADSGTRDPAAAVVVPVDTRRLLGADDLWFSPSASSGPIAVRCAHEVEVPASWLQPKRVSRSLDEHSLSQVKHKLAEKGPAAMHEAVEDPEYARWIEEVRSAADSLREIVALGSPWNEAREARGMRPVDDIGTGKPVRPGMSRWWLAAAALVAILAGVLFLEVQKQQRARHQPALISHISELPILDTDREPGPLRIDGAGGNLLVYLVLRSRPDCAFLQLQVLDAEGEVRWTSPELELPDSDEVALFLPERLGQGWFSTLRVLDPCQQPAAVIEEHAVRFEIR